MQSFIDKVDAAIYVKWGELGAYDFKGCDGLKGIIYFKLTGSIVMKLVFDDEDAVQLVNVHFMVVQL